MSDETDAAARRYSRDMRRIREDRDVSIEDIHEDTRIAQTLIESFEDSTLYNHPSFNRIYLRSFIRVYAEAIELPPDEALEALEAALEGTYQNELSARYLERETTEREDTSFSQRSSPSRSSSDGEEEKEASDQTESSDSYPGTAFSAGGVGGGGIVGPARAAGQQDESSSEKKTSDSKQDRSGSSSPHSDEDSSVEEEDSRLDSSLESSPAGQESSSSPSRSGTEDVPSGEKHDESSTREKESPEKNQSGSEFGSAEIEEDPGEERREGTSWEEQEPVSSPGSSREEEVDQPLDGGVSGIVGGPKELGSSSETPPTSSSSESSSMDTSYASHRSRTPSSSGLWDRRRREILSGVGILVLIGVLTGLTLYYSNSQSTDEGTASSDMAQDTSQTVPIRDTIVTATSTEPRPPASLSLGDTLAVTVFAESDLTEMRVQRDGDLRRPYWIETGEAVVFPFTSRITFENDLDDARFFLERYPYPSPQQDDLGRIVIERDTVEAFADTLRGEPQSLSVPPDTIHLDSPIPGEVLE